MLALALTKSQVRGYTFFEDKCKLLNYTGCILAPYLPTNQRRSKEVETRSYEGVWCGFYLLTTSTYYWLYITILLIDHQAITKKIGFNTFGALGLAQAQLQLVSPRTDFTPTP